MPEEAAPAIEPGQSAQTIAAAITERLRTPEGADAPSGSTPPPANAGATAPPDTAATGDDDQGQADRTEESPPPIEPPRSWSKEARERWSGLDRATQEYLLQRDSEDSAAVRRGQNEAAEARKRAEAELAAVAAERQRTAQQLQFFSQHLQTYDPVLAEGAKTDWTKLANDNPAEYVARKAQFDQRVQIINHIEGERQRLNTESRNAAKMKMVDALRRDMNLDDKSWQAFDRDVTNYLMTKGFKPEFIEQIVDPTSVQLAHKAMLYDKLMAERAALEQKKKAPPTARVMRPGAILEGNGSDARFEAAKKAALKSGSARAVADLITARLRANPQP